MPAAFSSPAARRVQPQLRTKLTFFRIARWAMLKGRTVIELERDYLAALERVYELPTDAVERLRAYHTFIRKHSHHLACYPAELLALAHAQPLDSSVLADVRQQFDHGPDRAWFRLLNPPSTE